MMRDPKLLAAMERMDAAVDRLLLLREQRAAEHDIKFAIAAVDDTTDQVIRLLANCNPLSPPAQQSAEQSAQQSVGAKDSNWTDLM